MEPGRITSRCLSPFRSVVYLGLSSTLLFYGCAMGGRHSNALLSKDRSLLLGQSIVEPSKVSSNRELVVLVHGMTRTPLSMVPLKRFLQQSGYEVLNFGYLSFGLTVRKISEKLSVAVTQKMSEETFEKVHFVGHSLGAIVIRHMLSVKVPKQVGRVVMLAPPNQGSTRADSLVNWLAWLYRVLPELTTNRSSTVRSLPEVPAVQVGIVAGSRDSTVRLEQTRLNSQTDHVVVSSGHSLIMFYPEVHRRVVHFLARGSFQEETSEPVKSSSTTVTP